MSADLETNPLANPDVLIIDRDADMVLLDGQLEAIYDAARRKNFGRGQEVRPEEIVDFSFKPLGIEDPWELHEFIIDTMSDPDLMLPATPYALEGILDINEAAAEVGTIVLNNVLTSRTERLQAATNRQLDRHYPPGTFHKVNSTGNITPDPPELPKWRHHIESGIGFEALGLTVARVFYDDMAGAVDGCVNKGRCNLGIVLGDYEWNQGETPTVDPSLDPRLHKIVRSLDHRAATREVVARFFPNTRTTRRLLAS